MRIKSLVLAIGLLVPFLGGSPAVCQVSPEAAIEQYRLSPDSGLHLTFEARVVGNFNNERLLLEQPGQLMVAKIGEKFWKEGYKSGDRIRISGKLDTTSAEQNTLVADEIEVVSRGAEDRGPLPLLTVREISALKPGSPAVAIVRLEDVGERRLLLVDDTGTIRFDRGPRWGAGVIAQEKKAYVAVGITEIGLDGVGLRAVELAPLESYYRSGMELKARSIRAILAEKPVGKMVRARGHVVSFIGKEQVPILIEGEDVLIVRLDPQHEAMSVRAGQTSEAIGVYTEETIDGKTYGALRNARILPNLPKRPKIAGIAIPGL